MMKAHPLAALAASLDELWSPRVVAEMDDYYIKVAKLHGEFVWHSHPEEDELFLVLKGHLRMQLEDGPVELGEGQLCVVPKGVRHSPLAEDECHILLIERKSTLHTGDVASERAHSIADQLRPI